MCPDESAKRSLRYHHLGFRNGFFRARKLAGPLSRTYSIFSREFGRHPKWARLDLTIESKWALKNVLEAGFTSSSLAHQLLSQLPDSEKVLVAEGRW